MRGSEVTWNVEDRRLCGPSAGREVGRGREQRRVKARSRFYSEHDKKPLQDFEQGSNMIWYITTLFWLLCEEQTEGAPQWKQGSHVVAQTKGGGNRGLGRGVTSHSFMFSLCGHVDCGVWENEERKQGWLDSKILAWEAGCKVITWEERLEVGEGKWIDVQEYCFWHLNLRCLM